MGNAASVEVEPKASKPTQKLSKPRTGNPSTAGLFNSNGIAEKFTRSSATKGRRLSTSQARAPSMSHDLADSEIVPVREIMVTRERNVQAVDHLTGLTQGNVTHRSQSIGVMDHPTRGRRTSMSNSSYIGTEDGYEQAEQILAGSLSKSASRSSFNYDPFSYEARRLRNLAEEPTMDGYSIASEGQFQATGPRRQSLSSYHHPIQPGMVTPLSRTNSDVSLYTPMRRKSLMTPGVATRPAPIEHIVSPNLERNNSVAGSSTRFDSFQGMGAVLLSVPEPSFEPEHIHRPETPHNSEYQTGAFKRGTLRITNGSPASTPSCEPKDELYATDPPVTESQGNDVEPTGEEKGNDKGKANIDLGGSSNGSQNRGPLNPDMAPSGSVVLGDDATTAGEPMIETEFVPEFTESPISISDIRLKPWALALAGKHTMEDFLFEEDWAAKATEILSISADPDGGPDVTSDPMDGNPAAPIQCSENSRSDSGVIASPEPQGPRKSLSKADSGYSSGVSVRSSLSKGRGSELASLPFQALEHVEPMEAGNAVAPSRSGSTVFPEIRLHAASNDRLAVRVPDDDSANVLMQETALINELGSSPANEERPATTVLATETVRHSSLTISNTPQKGRFQRFLSGTRAPLTVHDTHSLEKAHDLPPVPKAVQARLQEHAKTRSRVSDSLALGTEGRLNVSKSTTVTETLVVEHHTMSPVHAASPANARGEDKSPKRKSSFNFQALSSTITRAASSVMGKNSTGGKSTDAKTKQAQLDVAKGQVLGHSVSMAEMRDNLGPQGGQEDADIAVSVATNTTTRRARYRRLPIPKPPLSSLSNTGRSPAIAPPNAPRQGIGYNSEQHVTHAPRLPWTGQHAVSKTPPPVSLKTRHSGLLSVSQPARPRSTPPGRPEAPTMSRTSSREGLQGYSSHRYAPESSRSASRRSSQESSRTYSTTQSQALTNRTSYVPNINNTNPAGYVSASGGHRVGIYSSHSYQSTTLPGKAAFDQSRHSSMVSQASQQSGSSYSQPVYQVSPPKPTLRHRSSYDGHPPQVQNYGQNMVVYPTLYNPNEQPSRGDLASNQPLPQQSRRSHHSSQAASQGHLRQNSFEQHRPAPPYRVLHSYNSPSYRHGPIRSK
ncbi:hypothetical protein GGS20DRAFT_233640 [Poronia punctata]|nr:hypothetical protein GGS20DRAFT_233640 [Poronia punctata]